MAETTISVVRIRFGVSLLVLWWIPFWLAEPGLARLLNITTPAGKRQLTVTILIVQTILGLVGIWIAGLQVVRLVRQTPNKQIPKTFWRALRHGQLAASTASTDLQSGVQ